MSDLQHPFDSGRHSRRELSAQGQTPRRLAEGAAGRTQHASIGMTRSLSRWVHRDPPRAAPPDSWRSLRSARVPPMHYPDKQHRPSLGAIEWVRIRSAKRTKLGQNSTGVDTLDPGHSEQSQNDMRVSVEVRAIYWHLPRHSLSRRLSEKAAVPP